MEILTPQIRGHLAVPRTVPMCYPFTAQARPWGDTETGSAAACQLYKVLGALRKILWKLFELFLLNQCLYVTQIFNSYQTYVL